MRLGTSSDVIRGEIAVLRMLLLFLSVLLLASRSSFAAPVCVTLSADQTAVIAGPFPLQIGNGCSQYGSTVTQIDDSDSRYTAYVSQQTAIANQNAKVAAAQSAVAAAQAAGIKLTCTTHTAFNGLTFDVLPTTTVYLNALTSVYTSNGATFPNATAVPNLLDTSAAPHPIVSQAQLKAISSILLNYAQALQTYLVKVMGGQSPSLPPATQVGTC